MSEPTAIAKLAQVDPTLLGDPAGAEEIQLAVLETAGTLDDLDPASPPTT